MIKGLRNRIEKLEKGRNGEERVHVIMALDGNEDKALAEYKAKNPDAAGLFIIVKLFGGGDE